MAKSASNASVANRPVANTSTPANTPANTPTAPAVNTPAAPASASASTAKEGKKASKAFMVYVDAAGKTFNSPQPTTEKMVTEFSNGVKRTLEFSTFPEAVLECAMQQGFATRLQRSYQAEKEIDKCIEAFDETVEDLKAGVWIESKAGQPRVTLLATAIKMSLEAAGTTVDEARMASIIEKLKTAEHVEKAMANEHVKMHLANLKLEAAKARAEEARKSAKNAAPASLGDF